jgi:hypothetical protein
MLGLASNTSVMIGTPGYMAPEQITGDPVDHRADQFAIGVVFYELLAYSEAFPGDTLPMITHRILNEEPVPLSRLAPDAPPELIAIIQQSLRKNPGDRFADSEALRVAIARVRRDTSNQAWNLNTVALSRDTPPPPTATRGTGSARRRENDAVGVAQLTPPPDPRRTDREALARRRAIQLDAALTQARALMAQGQLEAALDACQQALTYDENHVGALRLEEEIEAAMRGTLTTDVSPEISANLDTLWPNLDVRPSEIATQLEPTVGKLPSGAVDRTALRLPKAPPPDATVIAPPRRTPAPTPASSVPATPAPGVPMVPVAPPPVPRTPAPQAKAPVAPVAPPAAKVKAPVAPAPKKPSSIGPAVAGIAAQSKVIADKANAVVLAVSRDKRLLSVAAIVVGVVVAAVVGIMMFSGPAVTGSVVIDAVPWGTITAIETDGGEAVSLPPSPSTPLALTLPVGTYHVTVAGPTPESQPQRITVEVLRDAPGVAPVIRFRALTPEEYFEQYLAAPTAPTLDLGVAPAVPTPATPTPSSPVAPPATGSNP